MSLEQQLDALFTKADVRLTPGQSQELHRALLAMILKTRTPMEDQFYRFLLDHLMEDAQAKRVAASLAALVGEGCACHSRKCGPHRCWPSRVGWGWVIALTLVIWWLMGEQSEKRSTIEFTLAQQWETINQAKWKQIERTLDEQRTNLQAILRQAQEIVWVQHDPLLDLKHRVERLEQP